LVGKGIVKRRKRERFSYPAAAHLFYASNENGLIKRRRLLSCRHLKRVYKGKDFPTFFNKSYDTGHPGSPYDMKDHDTIRTVFNVQGCKRFRKGRS